MIEKPIRILHFIGSLNTGGSQTMIMNIYRNINRKKIQFDFVVDRKNELMYKSEIEKLGGKVFVFEKYFNGMNILDYRKQWNDFFNLHKEYKVIHCHVRSVASLVLSIAKKHNLITICHSHGASNGTGIKAIGKKIMQSSIHRYSDYLLACSTDSACWLYGTKNASSNRCIIINNGININKFKFNDKVRNIIRKKYHLEENEYLIGHVGRFDPIKNHGFIVEIAKILEQKNISYKIMLCGDGSTKDIIKSEISINRLDDRFIFVNSNNEIYNFYNAFDLFLLPSKYEGLGIVLIEAQYNGLTCIASDTIPKEACISDSFISLPLYTDKWVECIINEINKNKRNNKLYPSAKKYDINQSCKILYDLYLNIVNGVNYERINEL